MLTPRPAPVKRTILALPAYKDNELRRQSAGDPWDALPTCSERFAGKGRVVPRRPRRPPIRRVRMESSKKGSTYQRFNVNEEDEDSDVVEGKASGFSEAR